jgi:hypothetical protein
LPGASWSARLAISALLLFAVFLAGCAGPPITVSIASTTASPESGQQIGLVATVSNDVNGNGVQWALACPVLTCGAISAQAPTVATYTAPTVVGGNLPVTITATSARTGTAFGTLLITVHPKITISSWGALATGQVGSPYSASLAFSGGVTPYGSWAMANGSNPLPSGLSLDSTTGVISGIPNTGAVGTTFFTVQLGPDVNSIIAVSETLSIAILPNGVTNSELNGTYAFCLAGFDSAGNAQVMAGSLVADGSGNVTSGVMDVNDAAAGPNTAISISGGNYVVNGPNNRGSLSLLTSSGTFTFDFSLNTFLLGVAQQGYVISSQPNTAMSGLLAWQNPVAFKQQALAGDFVFGWFGSDANFKPDASAGVFSTDSFGVTITSGELDDNDNGVINAGATGPVALTSGTFGSVDPTYGRVTLSALTSALWTANEVLYLVSDTQSFFISQDPLLAGSSPLVSGSVLLQVGTRPIEAPFLNGINIFNSTGPAPGGTDVQVGRLTTDGIGDWALQVDENDAGVIHCPPGAACANPDGAQNGSYAMDISGVGRATASASQGTAPAFIWYLGGKNNGFSVSTGPNPALGYFQPQTAGPFLPAASYESLGAAAPAGSAAQVESGAMAVSLTGNVTGVVTDMNSIAGGLQEGVPGPNDEVAVDSTTGRLTFASGNAVGYLVSATQSVMIPLRNAGGTSISSPALILGSIQ